MGRLIYTVYAVIVVLVSSFGTPSSGGSSSGGSWGSSSSHSGWSSSGSHK